MFSKAQDDYALPSPRDFAKNPAKTAGFIELGGNAGLYSLNIDLIYYYKEKFKLSVRGGFAPHFNSVYIEQIYLLENNFILFKNPHHLELGLGATMQRRYNERPNEIDNYFWENILFSVWRCGYRYQKQEDGFFLRAGITPVIMSSDALGFHPDYFQFWAGVSLGLSF
ncbi:MAG: hypothetical protein V4565_00885 [Bacteroidota bacterium]